MIIHCTEIDSTLAQEIYYDDKAQSLQVRFPNGDWYQYERVSNTEFQDLIRARSVGRHLNFHVKGAKSSTQIEDERAGSFDQE